MKNRVKNKPAPKAAPKAAKPSPKAKAEPQKPTNGQGAPVGVSVLLSQRSVVTIWNMTQDVRGVESGWHIDAIAELRAALRPIVDRIKQAEAARSGG